MGSLGEKLPKLLLNDVSQFNYVSSTLHTPTAFLSFQRVISERNFFFRVSSVQSTFCTWKAHMIRSIALNAIRCARCWLRLIHFTISSSVLCFCVTNSMCMHRNSIPNTFGRDFQHQSQKPVINHTIAQIQCRIFRYFPV